MNTKPFALMTDFGSDFAVASMKGLILKDFPSAQIVDVDHSVTQFSVMSGAFVLSKVYKYFPEGTIFICIVDPGVGSKREPICLTNRDYTFIGPNNGLFHYLIKDPGLLYESYLIKDSFKPAISNTFHGRDLFTPAAIEVAKNNIDIFESIDKDRLVTIPILDEGSLVVTYIDSFGNIKTNIHVEQSYLKEAYVRIAISGKQHLIRFASTFSDVSSGELLCYKGSNDTVEIAANLASAKDILGVNVGDRVVLEEFL